jgi:N6-adenosine-specific RNA methylase IME4
MEDINALPVESIAAEDATLFLWATSTLLPEAFATLAAWGFSYKCIYVWDKERLGLGNRFRIQTEFMLVATRGKPDWLVHDEPNLHRGGAGKHSAKPAAIRELVGRCVVGPCVELFAREVTPGWAAMGNELVEVRA